MTPRKGESHEDYLARERQKSSCQRVRRWRALNPGKAAENLKKSRDRRKSGNHVYFIQAGGPEGPVKIGFTNDVAFRFLTLKVGNHEPLYLINAIPGTKQLEREMHLKFKPIPRGGEWFYFDPEMLKVSEFDP